MPLSQQGSASVSGSIGKGKRDIVQGVDEYGCGIMSVSHTKVGVYKVQNHLILCLFNHQHIWEALAKEETPGE